MAESKQLVIPDPVKRDPESFEVVRVWVSKGQQHVSLRTGVWKDPFAWGIMLADLARHIVNAHVPNEADRDKVLQRIKAGFDAELQSPTDQPTGRRGDGPA